MKKTATALLSAAACLSIAVCADLASADKIESPSIQSTDPVVNAVNEVPEDICWRMCRPTQPACPEGWTAQYIGSCWTCCRDS